MLEKITKNLKTTVNDVTEKGIVTIGITQFDEYDADGDRMFQGAFTKTWNEGKQVHLLHHQKNLNSFVGLPVSKDPKTGIIDSQLNLNKQLGRDLLEDYKFSLLHGRPLQHSHGFHAVAGKYQKNEKGGRDFYEIKQFEYSTLLFGAVANTPVFSVKSEDSLQEMQEFIKELEDRVSVCGYTDEYGKLLEVKIKELKSMILEPQLHSEINEPSVDTQKAKQFYSLIKV